MKQGEKQQEQKSGEVPTLYVRGKGSSTEGTKEDLKGTEGEDEREETPAARAVMGAFWEGSRLAFQRFAPCGTPWKDYDHFRESAWRDSDSRANILHPTATVEEAIARSMGGHWAAVAKAAEEATTKDTEDTKGADGADVGVSVNA